MARILFNQVYKLYGKEKSPVVKSFNLEINDGEFVVLVGPSGCGKSTTLRMIAGLETVSEGDIYIEDERVNDLPPKDRDIAMVFQNYALYPNMNVYENIAFGLRLRKEPKHEIDIRVKRAARVLEIEPYLNRKPAELSGGQRQRVALGRAIVRQPQTFLMDEPLSNLDAKLRTQMRAEIISLHKKIGVTTIYVTHDQIEAMTMGQRIVVMKDGEIQQVGTPEDIYDYPANTFVARFIGTPPMNFIEGNLAENDGRLEFHTDRFCIRIPDDRTFLLRNKTGYLRSIVMGVRPEHMSFVKSGEEDPHSSVLPGIAKFNEYVGSDRFYHLDIGSKHASLIVRAHPAHRHPEGTKLNVAVDMSKALFFHAETGELLKAGMGWS